MTLARKQDTSATNTKILVVVLDGVGITDISGNLTQNLQSGLSHLPAQPFLEGDAFRAAYTPNINRLFSQSLYRTLLAHGTAVGLPSDDDMGNSEVGHNAMGAGRIFDQGAKLVNNAIQSGSLFQGDVWKKMIHRKKLKSGESTLHLCGLFSDGNVHSHIQHVFEMISHAAQWGVTKIRLHVLLDGRDVAPKSALTYVEMWEHFQEKINKEFPQCDVRIASGGGRGLVTMDRYESDWNIVNRGYHAHVCGEGEQFPSLRQAVEHFYSKPLNSDQDIPPFVIVDESQTPLGPVENDDSFLFFNFRGDRAIQITNALTQETFTGFQRKRFPKIHYAGMMQYDGDLKIPENFLVSPPVISETMTELLSQANVKQFACSETQKYGHVTYFWNGNRSGKFSQELENYIEIPSDQVPFQQRPWMKSAEITDATIREMESNSFTVGRINLANGDMVGHTGDFAASVCAVMALDLALGRLMESAQKTNTILVVTADHGNCDEMLEKDKKTKKVVKDAQQQPRIKTSHTLNPVPLAIYNTEVLGKPLSLRSDIPKGCIAHVAPTVLDLAGFEVPKNYLPSLIQWCETSNPNTKSPESLLESAKKKDLLSPLIFAQKIAREAYDLGFTYPTLNEIFQEAKSEVFEVEEEIQKLNLENKDEIIPRIEDEMGDVVFGLSHVLAYLAAHIHSDLDFNKIVTNGVEKFIQRFQIMEDIKQNQSSPLTLENCQKMSLKEWETLWKMAKKQWNEKSKKSS